MNCLTCDRPMRKSRHKATDYPGTVAYGSRDNCSNCHKALQATGQAPPPAARIKGLKEAQAIASAPANQESLAAYLRWRAPYRLKAGTQ